jgi:cyclopropane fatty-acyl-phospholipid synthase-like methyltransferase
VALRTATDKEGTRVLDIGCGAGQTLITSCTPVQGKLFWVDVETRQR